MQRLVLAACVMMLGACSNDPQSNAVTGDSNIVSEDLRGNDITAIDAATNDAANMAADAEIIPDDGNLSNEADEANEADNADSGNEA